MDAVSTVSGIEHVAELLKANNDYVLLPHINPDPDAIGAIVGLGLALKAMGKTVCLYTDETPPDNCTFIETLFPLSKTLPATAKKIYIDGGERKRLPESLQEEIIWMNLDHHLENGQFAEYIYVDTAACASSLIVQRLIGCLGVPLTEPMATALFAGLLFDTRGGFITGKCTPEVFNAAAELVAAGAKPDLINRLMNEQLSFGDVQLYGEALARLETVADGQVIIATVPFELFQKTGGGDNAIELLTAHLPKIKGGEIYILLREHESGPIRTSFRSKGRIPVNTIAKQFNGGGHAYAAGARIEANLTDAIAQVKQAAVEALKALSV
jgi:bifunctional oligoribonuclease and PAP phosphatase NrnA